MNQRPVEVLLVEDSPSDAHLTRAALLQGPVPKHISLVTDGGQAIDFVRRRGQFKHAPRPDLILLDLNLPKRDGLEVLRDIKGDPELRAITIVVFTTSQHPSDINSAYELSANCYIVKPIELDHFYAAMRGIEEFWMSLASLPTAGQDPRPAVDEVSEDESSNGKQGKASAHSHRRSSTRRTLPREPPFEEHRTGRSPFSRRQPALH
jgi:two-component system, chemotaxis family, response regulator Rcp1